MTYPIVEIPGGDVELADVKFTGEDKDLDAESTGVEVDTPMTQLQTLTARPMTQFSKSKATRSRYMASDKKVRLKAWCLLRKISRSIEYSSQCQEHNNA